MNIYTKVISEKEGGLYFTDNENVHRYIKPKTKIIYVSVPDNASVYISTNSNQYKSNQLIAHFLDDKKDILELQDIYLNIINKNENGKCIKNIPEKLKTMDMYLKIVTQNGLHLKYVPMEFKSFDICIAAITQNSDALEDVYAYVFEYHGYVSKHRYYKYKDMCTIACIKKKK